MGCTRTNNCLYHYGVQGQKKGKRQYQYEDGTWTELGKERRRVGDGRTKAVDKTDKKEYNVHGAIDPETLKILTVSGSIALGFIGAAVITEIVGNKISYDLAAKEMQLAGELAKDFQTYAFYKYPGTDKVKDIAASANLPLKKREMAIAEDLMLADIRRNEATIETNMHWKNNCGCAAVAYIMRRLGLDVVANPVPSGLSHAPGIDNADMDAVFKGFKQRAEDYIDYCVEHGFIKYNGFNGKDENAYGDRIAKRIKQLYPTANNALGIIGIGGPRVGHWFVWEKIGDHIMLIEPQLGCDVFDARDLYLIADGEALVDVLVRVDDLSVGSDALTKMVCARKARK